MGILRWTRNRVKCKAILLVLLVVILITGYRTYIKVTCSETESRDFIKNLCDQYHFNKVAGSYCAPLCDTKILTYEQCTNYQEGKRVAFMSCNGCEDGRTVRVVLKSKREFQKPEHPPAPQSDSEQSMKDFVNLLQRIVKSYFSNELYGNITEHKDVISFAWNWNYFRFVGESKLDSGQASLLAYKSIMSLLEQPEYLLSRYLHDKSYMPKMYGSCGAVYFVEYTEALHSFEFDFGLGKSTWKDRATIALKLLDLLRSLDKDHKQQVHLCDVKPDNFGRGSNSRMTLIDTDCVFFEDQLKQQFLLTNCSDHADCDFFDCRGFCDVNAGKCLPERTNNNVQSLCEDVFQGFSPKLPTGLLRDPPKDISGDLYQALQECAYPGNQLERHSARQRTSEITVNKLEQIIRLSLKFS